MLKTERYRDRKVCAKGERKKVNIEYHWIWTKIQFSKSWWPIDYPDEFCNAYLGFNFGFNFGLNYAS